MLLTYAVASVPLVKTISQAGTDPYPKVSAITSVTDTVHSIGDFYTSLSRHSVAGHALMKGPFLRPLVGESRSNLTDKIAPTQWMCLDFDGFVGNINDVLIELGLHNVDYIVQYSASQGIKPGLNAHYFFTLDKPIAPTELKRWLQWQNLHCNALSPYVLLNKSGTALKYPLDIVTADNSRMLYIGAPQFVAPMVDPLASQPRIQLVRGTVRDASIGSIPSELVLRRRIAAIITALQPPGVPNPQRLIWSKCTELGEDVASPTVAAKVTGVNDNPGSDFVYVNLNGGDSWGYYYQRNDPRYLFNFKGEPIYNLRDIAPELVPSDAPEVFVDYYNEGYIVCSHQQMHNLKTWQAVIALCNAQNIPIPDKRALRILQCEYRPYEPYGFLPTIATNYGIQVFNSFKMPPIEPDPAITFPVIEATIRHICVDSTTYDRFINWLAFIIQTRTKAKSAWVFTGVPGTGKGVLIDSIIKPLVGNENLVTVSKEVFESQFNPYASNNLFVVYDEARFAYLGDRMIDHKLKLLVTSDEIQINDKGVKHRMRPSFSNLIVTSNEHEVMRIATNDRRYNIAPRQEVKIEVAIPNYQQLFLQIPNELAGFKHFLLTYPVDVQKARSIIINDARDKLMSMNQWDMETVARVLRGDWAKLSVMRLTTPTVVDTHMVQHTRLNELIDRWATEQRSVMSLEDLYTITAVFTTNRLSGIASLIRRLRQVGIEINNDPTAAWETVWVR